VRNRSEQFEGRVGLVEVLPTPSIFYRGMEGSVLPIAVAHGEGRAEFANEAAEKDCSTSGLVSLRWVDNHGQVATRYPSNPNGSPAGITGLTTTDGRVTIVMPHPERVLSHRAELVAPGKLGRGRRLDADVPQRTSGSVDSLPLPLQRERSHEVRGEGARSAGEGARSAGEGSQSLLATRPIGVILSSVSSAKNFRTIIACCSLPLRT
jgi:hypothetical protein